MEQIGVDLIEVKRIQKAIEKWGERFLKKAFTNRERDFCEKRKNKYESYAVRFAAKEAVSKVLGTGLKRGVALRDIEILDNEKSRPTVILYGKAKDLSNSSNSRIILSLSHTKEYAIAMAIMNSH